LFVYSYKDCKPFDVRPVVHGNAKTETHPFTGMSKEILQSFEEKLSNSDPKNLYNSERVQSSTVDILSRKTPRNLKQLQNLKYKINRVDDPVSNFSFLTFTIPDIRTFNLATRRKFICSIIDLYWTRLSSNLLL
jgi:hypothetical protein